MICLDENLQMAPTRIVESVQFRTTRKGLLSECLIAHEAELNRAGDAIVAAVTTAHDVLNTAQRKQLTAFVRSHHGPEHGGGHGHGHFGKHEGDRKLARGIAAPEHQPEAEWR